jgi:hypothetical protein
LEKNGPFSAVLAAFRLVFGLSFDKKALSDDEIVPTDGEIAPTDGEIVPSDDEIVPSDGAEESKPHTS